jgi:arylamine N-acetyltransferase
MPLSQGQISKWGATKAETRLTYEENANQIVQGLWTLEHRISESQDWVPIYHFGMTEFLPQDFETMNFATSNRKTSFFTYKILCLNLIYDEDVDDITGALILNGGELKRRIYENSEILIDCKTEKERVGVLKEHFGIILSEREKAAIRSTVTELTG